MLDPKKTKLIFKYKQYADLANSDIWVKFLKPDLLKISDELSKTDLPLDSSFATIKRDITRSQTNKIINRIIKLIENAESSVDKTYKK